MKGQGRTPLKIHWKDIITSMAGSFIAILLLDELTNMTDEVWLMASFGSSSVLAFSFWQAPLSQPRNIIGGHLVSTTVGVTFSHLFGTNAWTISLALAFVIFIMALTKTTHPPAGGDAIAVMLGGYGWGYILFPVLTGSIIIVILALIINNVHHDRRYPLFWI
ncbi:HPP family protein [Bacillus sp. 1P06AnD]|uniref:HPP family protein n=1 Tax=Bacillus sp. 1P06AnD TaxID=3132208 RepID=UPI0039A2089D